VQVNDDVKIREILKTARTIAVVGVSQKPGRDSGRIARFLHTKGYTVFPVNPSYTTFDDQRCYPTLRDLPVPIDIVDVFRRPDEILTIVDDAIAIGARVLWCQLGVVNEEAAERAVNAGMDVIMDRCIAVDYNRLMI
jgi:predicted CoA-binding protein